ncbi:MAG: sialate O-acetylesterase [Terriglobales bacterium]
MKRGEMKPLRIAIAASVLAWSVCWADPVLPALFSDHMVLQRGSEIHIWGKADPSEKIAVSIAGRSGTATTDATGRWSVQLPGLPAGGPFTLTIQGNKKVELKDVMIGEVWVASGQSNMTFALSSADGAENEVPKANYSQIRFFTVPKRISLTPQESTQRAGWQICTPDTAKNFSAVAYFFARDLYRSLGVPIGVIQSAWPGTTIEEWLDPDIVPADPELAPILEKWTELSPTQRQLSAEPVSFDLEYDDFELLSASSSTNGRLLANFDDGTSNTSLGGSFSYSWADAPDSIFELLSPGRGDQGFAARVEGRLDGAQGSTLTASYTLDHSPVDLSSHSGIRFWVRGNGSFRFRSLQPTITDYDDYANQVLKATADWKPVTVLFRDLRQEGWGVSLPFTQASLSGFSIENLTSAGYLPMPVFGLYEGMITPLLPYEIRGTIWYQGESNALKAQQYRKLLPALIAGWRKGWKNQDMEFLIVQLPNHGATPEQPSESAWAELREAQLLTMKNTPHTGLAVTIDVGDPNNVHPHRKLEVGQRLALWALGTTYGKPVVYSGPIYDSMKIEGAQARIHFTHIGSGLEARGGGALQGFSIAGADRRFHWADARIEGDTVSVSSPEVVAPSAVRYAWADSPQCNLFNKNGLPASPFRTDDWPGITGPSQRTGP